MTEETIKIENLTRRFGKVTALSNVNLTMPQGIVLGLVGENGSGKTTLIKHLLGLLRAKEGHVRVFGKNPVADPEYVLARLGYLSEHGEDLPGWMRIKELSRYTRAFYPRCDSDYGQELCETFGL
jgi:ABC-2 type transport system ATP-binding protein